MPPCHLYCHHRTAFCFLIKQKFVASFAADVDAKTTEFIANSQVPWGLDALNGAISQPAWRIKPSWYLLVTKDKMIPLAAQQLMLSGQVQLSVRSQPRHLCIAAESSSFTHRRSRFTTLTSVMRPSRRHWLYFFLLLLFGLHQRQEYKILLSKKFML